MNISTFSLTRKQNFPLPHIFLEKSQPSYQEDKDSWGIPGNVEVRSTRKGIILNHFGSEKMNEFKIVFKELKRPFCLPLVQFLWVLEVIKVFMVRVDNNFMRGSLDIVSPIL